MKNLKITATFDGIDETNMKALIDSAAEMGHTLKVGSPDADLDFYKDADVIFGMPKSSYLPHLTDLEWLHASFAGVERYCDGSFPSEVTLTNSAGAFGEGIAESMLCGALMCLRNVPHFYKNQQEQGWNRTVQNRSLYGKKVVIIGMGDIGRSFANICTAFGTTVIGVRRSADKSPPKGFAAVYPTAELDSVLPDADLVALCLPSTPETEGLLSKGRIALMKHTAIVLNVGRGVTIDQEALIEALNSGKLGGAYLDVVYPEPLPTDHPLWSAKNTVITPHVSGTISYPSVISNVNELFLENLRRYTNNEPLLNVVDTIKGY